MAQLTVILIVAIAAVPCNAFLFDVKTDCLLSTWSEWTNIPGLAAVSRDRSILRHDHKGGVPCPPTHDLRQVKVTKPVATTPNYFLDTHQLELQHEMQQRKIFNDTAHSIAHNFLRRVNIQPVVDGEQAFHFRDLLIVLDSSGSIGDDTYNRTKRSVSGLLETLCPDPDPFGLTKHHAAMIVYSGVPQVQFDFKTYYTTSAIQNAIEKAPYLNSNTCTTDALNKAFDMFSSRYGMRQSNSFEKEVLILTDGQSNCLGDVFAAAYRLQKKARVFALLIGEPTESGLEEIASYVTLPVPQHLFALENFKQFDELIKVLKDPASGIEDCVPFNPQTE